jgi:cytochrome P450
MCFLEDMTIKGICFKKGDEIIIDQDNAHRNPDEWFEPERFIPERFDPSSKYFLTPHGTKRHPFSLVPFGGGRRICIGKTYAEIGVKIVALQFISEFDIEFVNEKELNERYRLNSQNISTPSYFVRLLSANH